MKRFAKEKLSPQDIERLQELSRRCKGDILTMTTLCDSGHPGGSMSSLDIFLTAWSFAGVSAAAVDDPGRDRIVVSHGHTSPGVYAVLGRLGFCDREAALPSFRASGSIYEGHVVRNVPGVEWGTGNLGQGLSAACGFALAAKLHGRDSHVFCLMSDGEQTKGQVAEARRFAVKYGLSNITVAVDYNGIQISGSTAAVMPCGVADDYAADCWEVVEVDGHDHAKLYDAFRKAVLSERPVCIVAHTVLGKGVSFMENKHVYHGKSLTADEYGKAMGELGLEPEIEKYRPLQRKSWTFPKRSFPFSVSYRKGEPIVYPKADKNDNRTAYGKALADLAKLNRDRKDFPIAVFDCDLATSVKTDLFEKEFPERFFQVGVQEHHAATVAGAASIEDLVCFFSDFGVFGVDETYNQARLNDQNHTNLRLVCTHVGLDVGEDGKTHQCIDYVGLLRNCFGFKVIVPADSNQTDRVIRAIVDAPGNFFVGMGRSKAAMVTREDGELFYDAAYAFRYGAADILREGKQGYFIAMGCLVNRALDAHEMLKAEGISVGVINMSCPLVIDEPALAKAAATGHIFTCEDHHVDTGLGATVALHLAGSGYAGKLLRSGVREYGSSGKPDYLFALQGLDASSLAALVKKEL